MITETITRDVAEAQVSDDCQVELWVGELRKNRIATLTPTQAHILAAELIDAAERADEAAEERRHEHEPAAFDVQHIHPECVAGKCGNCDAVMLTVNDEWVPCDHHCHERTAA